MTEKSPTKILEFLEGKGTGAKGRNLDEIIDQDDECWSHQHDFIQWLSLLNGNSLAVPKSPILEDSQIINFRESLVA